jgi:hypothetical protein
MQEQKGNVSLAETYISVYVTDMNHIGIRDLQKMSGETITALPGPTPVKSGDRTVAILIPLKPANMKRLEAALVKAGELAKGRDSKADDEALRQFGEVDPANWDDGAVRKLMHEARKT